MTNPILFNQQAHVAGNQGIMAFIEKAVETMQGADYIFACAVHDLTDQSQLHYSFGTRDTLEPLNTPALLRLLADQIEENNKTNLGDN